MRYFKRSDNNTFHPVDQSTPYCVEYGNGTKYYYSHNFISHREDGAAREYSNGYKYYFLNGQCYGSETDYTDKSWIRFVKLKVFY